MSRYPRTSRKPSSRRATQRKRLRFETLEQRRLLTLWTVTDLSDVIADDGEITLREAIQAAATNEAVNEAIAGSESGTDQIRFADELFQNGPQVFRIEGAEGPLRAMGDLSIVGPGVDENGNWLLALNAFVGTQVIVAEGDMSVLSVSGVQLERANGSALLSLSGDVIVENSRFFSNFTEESGGAIFHRGNKLTIRDSVFESNRATGDGGAISSLGEIVIQDSEFRGSFSAANGGVIASSDSLTVFNSTFIENDAIGDGGAIHVSSGDTLSSDQTRVFASNFLSNTSEGSGGAIFSDFNSPAEFDLEVGNSVFDRNFASVNGGAISNQAGTASIRETTLSNNVAILGGGINTTTDLLIQRSTLNSNVAVDGGAIASRGDSTKTNIVNTTISGNYATNLGGGVHQNEGELRVTNSTIVLNRSDSDNDGTGNGGGLAVQESGTIADTRLFNTILAGNLLGRSETSTTLDRSQDGVIRRWTTDGLATGKYRVLAHWVHDDSSVPLVISDGDQTIATLDRNFLRRPVPHMVEDDLDFESLGEFTITSGELSIQHDDRLDARLLIERIDDAASLNDIHMINPGTTIDVEKSFHNLIGNPDPSSTGGLEDDPDDLGNANFVGNFGDPWDINRIIFTDLADNLGGVTAVHPLQPLSPAIDEGSPFLLSVEDGIPFDEAGNPLVGTDPSTGAVAVIQSDGNGGFVPRSDIVTADQRGYPFLRADDQTGINARGNAVDIGAFEVQLNPLLRSGEIVVSTLDTFSDGDFSPGNLSLPEAVAIANLRTDHNTIRFTESLIREDDAVAAMRLVEPLNIQFDTTIAGPGAGLLAVTGEPTLFSVDSVANFEISGLLLGRSIQDSRGGAISNSGTTILDRVVVRDRSFPISNSPGGTLFVMNSQIHDNIRGGIINYGDLAVGPAVEIYDNSSVLTFTFSEGGGGIHSSGNGSLVIFDSIIRDNDSDERGGGIYSSSTSTEIRRSQITGNTSTQGGGGISIIFGSASISDTTIEGNTTARPISDDATLVVGLSPNGGGLQALLRENQSLVIDRSTISNNEANDPFLRPNGGGVFFDTDHRESSVTIRSSTISRNSASGVAPSGAGISGSGQGSSAIESTTIAFNEVVDLQVGGGAGAGARVSTPDFSLNNSLVVENHRRLRLVGEDENGNPRLSPGIDEDLSGIADEATNNIVGVGGGSLFDLSNTFGNIRLGPASSGLDEELNDNGGFTPTHELLPISPAIDTGERDGLLDQRGFPTTDNDLSSTREDSLTIVNGFELSDLEADVGAYESSEIVIQPFSNENRNRSQFDLGGSAVIGVGYDDGTPNSSLASEPGFLGLDFDLDPFVVGPGVGEGFFGDRYGGQATADVDARVGFEYGYYVNSGTVDTFYDGLFAYRVEEDAESGTFDISTGVAIQDGAIYTNSPNLGAYVDLVFEFNAAIRGEACLIWCASGGFDINIDQSEPLFSINRQKEDAAGNLLFEDESGNETTARQNGNSPSLDGEIMFSTSPLTNIIEGIEDDVIPPEIQAALDGAGGLAEYLYELREERREAEIEQARLESRRQAGDNSAETEGGIEAQIARIRDLISDESEVTSVGTGSGELCGGVVVVACFGSADGDLLGAQVDLSVGANFGKVGVGKKLGTLAVTVPEIKLSDTEIDANGRLSATTDDFLLGSPEDAKRQVAALSVDVAAIGPLGTYTVDVGPIGIEATTVSYNITPRFAVSQDVSVEPFFDTDHPASFTFDFGGGGTIDVTVGTQTESIVSGETVEFVPGAKLKIDAQGRTVDITPGLKVGNRFSNDLGFDFDIQGSLEVLALQLNAFGDEIFKVGPLFRQQHQLLESQNLFDLFNKTFNLDPTLTTLDTFTIGGAEVSAPGDGGSPGSAIALLPSISSGPLDGVAPGSLTYFSVPQVGADGLQRPDIRIETTANEIEFVRPPYAGLTLELINSSTVDGARSETAISSFEIPIAGVDLSTLSIPGWDGEVLAIRGFEFLLGGQAIFGLEFASSDPEITAEAVGGEAIAEFRDFEITTFDVLQNERLTNAFIIDNDFAFDIDDDGFISPTTDGELVVRFMNGLTGDALIADVVADEGRRQTAEEITAYLEGLKAPFIGNPFYEVPGRVITESERRAYRDGWSKGRRLDVDDSATIDSQTGEVIDDGIDPQVDGVLILRQMAGIGVSIASSPALTTGFTNADLGQRNNPQAISDFIDGKNHTAQFLSKDEPLRGSVRQDFLLSQERNIGLDAVPGSSPYNPIKATFVSGTGTYTLSEIGQTTTYQELILNDADNGDIVVSRNALDTPSRSFPVPQTLTQFASDPFADEINDLPLRRSDPSERQLGIDSDAPLFVELPDAAGFRVSLAAGMTFDLIDIDSAAAGNGFFDQERSLGLTLADLKDIGESFRTEFGITRTEGAVITEIESGSVGDRFGLQVGDVITRFNTTSVDSAYSFETAMRLPSDGLGSEVGYFRGATEFSVAVPLADFDLYVESLDQWFELTMDTPLDLPAGVSEFDLFPKASPNLDLLFAENEGAIDLDFVIGLTVAGTSTEPTLIVDVLADRQDPLTLSAFIPTVFPIETEYRIARNGAFLDFSIDGMPAPISSDSGLEYSFEILHPATILDGTRVDDFFTVQVDETNPLEFPYRNIAVNFSDSARGDAFVTMRVTDQEDNAIEDTFRVYVNESPLFSSFNLDSPTPDQYVAPGSSEHAIDLSGVFSGENLTFNVLSTNSNVTPSVDGTMLTLGFLQDADSLITVEAVDSEGNLIGSDTFRVSVGQQNSGNLILRRPIGDQPLAPPQGNAVPIFLDGLVTSSTDFTLAAVNGPFTVIGDFFIEDTLIIDAARGPLEIPVHFEGETVRIEGNGVILDLTGPDRLTGVATIDLRGDGTNKLILDLDSARQMAPGAGFGVPLATTIIVDADDLVEFVDVDRWTFDSDANQFRIPIEPTPIFGAREIVLTIETREAATPSAGPAPQTRSSSELNRSAELSNPPSQIITLRLAEGQFVEGEVYSIDVEYEVTNPSEPSPAVLVEVHYDSSVMSFNRVTNLRGESDFIPSVNANNAEDIELINDGESTTDSVVVLAWSDIRGAGSDWPSGATDGIRLATLDFTIESDVLDPIVRATGESSARFQFVTELEQPLVSLDFGDAPEGYPVSLADDGARHTAGALVLGSTIDLETDGVPSDDASGDGASDDGVQAITSIVSSSKSSTQSSVAITVSEAGKLDAWIDFDGNKVWDIAEQIFTSIDVTAGVNALSFTVPANATTGNVAARFRVSSTGNLASTGAAEDGEVEDYLFNIENAQDSTIDVSPTGASPVAIQTTETEIIVRQGELILFQGPADELAVVNFAGTSGDDSVQLNAAFDDLFAAIGVDGGDGEDSVAIAGLPDELLLDELRAGAIRNLEQLDLTGDLPQSISVSSSAIKGITDGRNTLLVRYSADDVFQTDEAWEHEPAEIREGKYIHRFSLDGALLEIDNSNPWQNPVLLGDVNRDKNVSVLDALLIINRLSRRAGDTSLPDPMIAQDVVAYYDLSGDAEASALDALRVINILARQRASVSSEEREATFTQQIAEPILPSQSNDDHHENTDTVFTAWESRLF